MSECPSQIHQVVNLGGFIIMSKLEIIDDIHFHMAFEEFLQQLPVLSLTPNSPNYAKKIQVSNSFTTNQQYINQTKTKHRKQLK